jgi:hypothetical protein
MRWYGRLNRDEVWARCPRSVLTKLIQGQLREALGVSGATAWFRPPRKPERTLGQRGYFVVESVEIPLDSLEWMGSKPRPDSLSISLGARTTNVVKLTAHLANGKAIAGAYFTPYSVFAVEEIEHALWSHFGVGKASRQPLVLFCSSERPIPSTLYRCAQASHRGLALYHCENPGCTGYRKPVLVPSQTDYHGGNHVGTIAYACPQCSGGWYDRWALTWLRNAEPLDLAREQFAQFPVQPTEQRRNALSGPISAVVQAVKNHEPWGWHPRNIRRLPRSFSRFLRTSLPSDLVIALRKEPEMIGDILPGVLQRGNLRAFVDYVRALPVEKRLNGIPRSLGHAFCPKRPSAYRVSQESVQVSHHFYIAYSPDLFMGYLHYYGVADCDGAFLDVGSGIGEKPFIAYACGRFDRCDGLEYDARTLAVAQFLLNQLQTDYRYPISYEAGDALQFSRYNEYDVIYMFRPMRDKAMMRELFLKIGAEMKIGATCMDVIEKDLAFRRIAENQYAMVSDVDANKQAIWGKTISLEDFLESMDFPAPVKA